MDESDKAQRIYNLIKHHRMEADIRAGIAKERARQPAGVAETARLRAIEESDRLFADQLKVLELEAKVVIEGG